MTVLNVKHFQKVTVANEILMYLRVQKKLKNQTSLQEPVGIDKDGNEISLIDVIPNDEDSVEIEVDKRLNIIGIYDKMQKVLKKREKLIVKLRYGLLNNGAKTQREIAKLLGISRSYVARLCYDKRRLYDRSRKRCENGEIQFECNYMQGKSK